MIPATMKAIERKDLASLIENFVPKVLVEIILEYAISPKCVLVDFANGRGGVCVYCGIWVHDLNQLYGLKVKLGCGPEREFPLCDYCPGDRYEVVFYLQKPPLRSGCSFCDQYAEYEIFWNRPVFHCCQLHMEDLYWIHPTMPALIHKALAAPLPK